MDGEKNYWSNRVSRRTALRGGAIGAAGLVGAALIGCGDDDDDDAAAPAAAAKPAPTAAAAKPAAVPAADKAGGITITNDNILKYVDRYEELLKKACKKRFVL